LSKQIKRTEKLFMRRNLIIQLLLLLSCVCYAGNKDNRLIIITFDGLRWQELFCGADSFLVRSKKFSNDPNALTNKYWRATPEERREVLMPFTWNYIAKNGYLLGNRNKGSQMQVANIHWFSYPGYSETFCGYADDKRIDSNDLIPNPNVSVLEVANKDPRYNGSVMCYGSWEAIRYAVNSERGGFPGSVAYEKNISKRQDATMKLLDDMLEGTPRLWGGVRYDVFTYAYAIETLKRDHPKVMYISFGETDEWAHEYKYDLYLDATRSTDEFIKNIVEYCESDKFYKGKTTYLLTCDHGRGYLFSFPSHGSGILGAQNTWFMAFGNGVEKLGETSNNGPFYNQQIAATIADVLGIDFTPSNGVKQKPIDPHYKGEPLVDKKAREVYGFFPALKDVTPKGHGVKYKYYEGEFNSVSDMEHRTFLPKEEGVFANFDVTKAKVEDHFGYQFSTLVKIPKTARYYISLTSDDGSKLKVDGNYLIDNDGSHGANIMEATVELEEGYHRFYVEYFEDYEGQSLEITLSERDGEYIDIPDSMLYYE